MIRPMINSGVDWIGDIPQNWRIGKVKQGFYRKKAEAHQEDPVILSLARAGVKKRDISNNDGQLAESYFNYNPVEPGDLLLNPMDLYSGANCSISNVSGVISPAYINLGHKDGFDPRYYDYYFKTQYWAMAMFAHGKGVSFDNRWTMNATDILNYYIPMPSYKEQQLIADHLDSKCNEIDYAIDKTRSTIEEYKALKQSLLTETVTKGIRRDRPMKDSGIEWIGDIPEDWEKTRVKSLGRTQNGISKSADEFGNGYPFVSYGDVYKNYELPCNVNGLVNATEEDRNRYSVCKGDIFFTRTSETIEEVGFSSVCNSTITDATFAGFLIRLRPYVVDDVLLTNYAKYYFRGSHIRGYLVKEMNLVTRASLSQSLLGAMTVLVPPQREQIQISEYLDDKCNIIDALIEQKKRLITELESYKKSLIYEYVTGKKEVPGLCQ